MNRRAVQSAIWLTPLRFAGIAAVLTASLLADSLPSMAQQGDNGDQTGDTVILDRVVAVVNRQVILQSDLHDELQLSVLDPNPGPNNQVTQQEVLERLISRALIEQQISQEDMPSAEPKPAEIATRLHEIRTELPACVRADCASDQGWKTFLTQHDLTSERVESYLRNRMKVLSFIELRFRQGIHISPEQIETYYREKLVPQYPTGERVPPVDQVSSRIEEILLEEQVNVLFDNWLANLRKQGQIEVLDPSLEAPGSARPGAAKE